jgi:6-pyruvoyltetrahydropterin/6-carboxytetrahydropterin synthase
VRLITETTETIKTFRNYPCSHRRWRHDGHCKNVHGYSREFTFTFRAESLTEEGFVIDFGKLGFIKEFLDEHFDHTLLLDEDDPCLPALREFSGRFEFAKIVTFPDVGMEGTSRFLHLSLSGRLADLTDDRVWIHSIEVRENDKNAGKVIFAHV